MSNTAYAWFETNGTMFLSVSSIPVEPTSTGCVTCISAFSANGSARMTPSTLSPVVASYVSQSASAASGKSGVMFVLTHSPRPER